MTLRTLSPTDRLFSFVVLAPHGDDAWRMASAVLRETGRRPCGCISQKTD